MYTVIRAFTDSMDENRVYKVGDTYPAEGSKSTKARTNSLLKGSNKNGRVYIREVENKSKGKEEKDA